MAGYAMGALGLALLPGAPAMAAETTVTPLGGTHGYLMLVEHDATFAGSETDGPVAVGGNLTLAGNFGVAMHSAGSAFLSDSTGKRDSRPTALLVGGKLDFSGGAAGSITHIGGQGWVKLGTLDGVKVHSENGATRITTGGVDATPRVELEGNQPSSSVKLPGSTANFSGAFGKLRGTSTSLAGCASNASLTGLGGGQYQVKLVAGRQNVLSVPAADLAGISTLTFSSRPSASTPLLINVDSSSVGGNVTWNVPNFSGIAIDEAQHILVNFPGASAVTLGSSSATLEGTLFAPGANVRDQSSSNVEGAIVASSLIANGSGEVHSAAFSGSFTCTVNSTPSSAASSGHGPSAGTSAPASTTPATTPGGAQSSGSGTSTSTSTSSSSSGSGSGDLLPSAASSAPAAQGSSLPVTGTNLIVILTVGVLLVAGGIVTLVLTKQRRITFRR